MYYQLTDSDSGEDLGIVKVTNVGEVANFDEEVKESWNEFHVLEEHDLDNCDVDEFVDWNNENRVTQIERVFLEIL
jgi:hypothetical protein